MTSAPQEIEVVMNKSQIQIKRVCCLIFRQGLVKKVRASFKSKLAALVVIAIFVVSTAQAEPLKCSALLESRNQFHRGFAKFISKVSFKKNESEVFLREESSMLTKNHSTRIALALDPSSLTQEVLNAGVLPRGSALMTSSGDLGPTGITAIIHAATGAMERKGGVFEPTLESISTSIKNSLILAFQYNHKRIAIPFIGGGVFAKRIGVEPQELANLIVETTLQEHGSIEIRFMTFGEKDTELFKHALKNLEDDFDLSNVSVVNGSITDFKQHGASAIVNAANLEVTFGGGLSGIIARATRREKEINQEAHAQIVSWLKMISGK